MEKPSNMSLELLVIEGRFTFVQLSELWNKTNSTRTLMVNIKVRELVLFAQLLRPHNSNLPCQEPITRSVQLNYSCATAFSQVRLFLD